MKKHFKSGIVAIAVAVVGVCALKTYQITNKKNNIVLDNIEALSQSESADQPYRSLATNASNTMWCCCPGNVDNCGGESDCEPYYGICR